MAESEQVKFGAVVRVIGLTVILIAEIIIVAGFVGDVDANFRPKISLESYFSAVAFVGLMVAFYLLRGAPDVRFLCFGGTLVTVFLFLLGFGWPSAIYTPFAILALPSPILFLIAAAYPSLVRNRRGLRYYLVGCCIASALCSIYQIWWDHMQI